MSRPADRCLRLAAALLCTLPGVANAQNTPAGPAAPEGSHGPLQTFALAKPAAATPAQPLREATVLPSRVPRPTELLRASFGLGYVQGADWGSELFATGGVSGTQVQLNALVTRGREGLRFDNGAFSVFDPDRLWRVEGGDLFSQLRGAAFGGRFSWAARGHRRPAVSVYATRRGLPARDPVVSYRDQLRVKGQTLLDAELASDQSYLLRTHLRAARLEVEALYRSQDEPFVSRDASVSAGLTLWRGVGLSGGFFRSRHTGDRQEWRMAAVRLPLTRYLDLTLERAFAGSRDASQSSSAAMLGVSAGDFRFFHRHQYGEQSVVRGGATGLVERQQTQSMSSYTPNRHLTLTLQLATQRTETGQVQHWEELQAAFRITPTTTLRTVAAVPDLRNAQRFQAYFRQELPRRFAVQADYGRLSAYQSVARELDRSRFRVMLYKAFDLATPARGATIRGRVLDAAGRGVAGARVLLGPYAVHADADGAYALTHVPAGEYELSLDAGVLPADYAWDGRTRRLLVRADSAERADLRVTPLNTIHGTVYVDRNANGRIDADEGVAGAVLRLGDQVTASDRTGAYSFHNVWPGTYPLTLVSVPPAFVRLEAGQTVTLRDGAPVTGADFRVAPYEKPILWEDSSR